MHLLPRRGGDAWLRQFANWTTGDVEGGGPISDGDSYWNKITDSYKAFEKSHWMPMRLDGITPETWPNSRWAKAMDHLDVRATRSALATPNPRSERGRYIGITRRRDPVLLPLPWIARTPPP